MSLSWLGKQRVRTNELSAVVFPLCKCGVPYLHTHDGDTIGGHLPCRLLSDGRWQILDNGCTGYKPVTPIRDHATVSFNGNTALGRILWKLERRIAEFRFYWEGLA